MKHKSTIIRLFSSKSHLVINPLNLKTISEHQYQSIKQILPIIHNQWNIHNQWKNVPLEERIEKVQQMSNYFENNLIKISQMIVDTVGKPIVEAEAEVRQTADLVRQMCIFAREELQVRHPLKTKLIQKTIIREPVGVAFIISCWNYPIFGPATLLVPAILAGNSVLLKPSPHSANLGSIFEEATQYIEKELVHSALMSFETCEKVIRNPQVGVCQFMGTNLNGKQILAEASHCSLHKIILELGGKDAAYADKSCMIERTIESITNGMFQNTGQSCYTIERLFVHREIADQFIPLLVKQVQQLRIGNPNNRDTRIGPIKLKEISDLALNFIEEAVQAGGQLLTGGKLLTIEHQEGIFLEPTLILGAPLDCSLMTTEMYGPVCGIQIVDSKEHALELMNDNEFGLTSAVYAEDRDVFDWMAARLDTGTVYVNKCQQVLPSLPWSGRKQSGRSFTLSRRVFDQVTQYKSIHYID